MKCFTMATALVALTAASAVAQTSYPMITHTTPVAVQRGQTIEVMIDGQMNFHGTYKALFEGTGLSAEIVTDKEKAAKPAAEGKAARAMSAPNKPQVRQVKMKLTVAPDAALGVREFRLASSLGISSVGQLLIVDVPVVQESGINNTPDKANPLTLPCVACGRIEAVEDVDCFKFHAEAGQIVTFEVFGARIEDKIHDLQKHLDPLVALFDAEGRELAANDDFYFADPLLSYTIAKAGDYVVQIRDSKYDGDARWVYALVATNKPYLTHLYPMAANPGQTLEVEPVGSAKSAAAKVSLQAPETLGTTQVQLDIQGTKTNPAAFIVSRLPQVSEQEPNDSAEHATRVSLPCGINGRISKPRELDHFQFVGSKGKAIRFEVQARRFGTMLQSSIDSVLDVLDAKGVVLANNDDANGKDAALVFTPPADGEYFLRIRDLNSKGGDTFVYYIEADHAKPDFALRCDPDKAMIGPGSSTTWFLQVARTNGFAGPVKVEVKGLPRGVTVSPLTIVPSMTQGILVLTAAADAAIDAANVEVLGTATAKGADGKEETLVRQVTAIQEIYSPGGGRARFDVNLHTVAVTEPSDILKVEVTPKEIKLKPGEEIKVEVTIQRRPDYDKTVSLDVLLRHLGGVNGNPLPASITLVENKSKTLLGTGNQGHIVLKAAANATSMEEPVPISVMAHVSINFVVKVSYSSPPILLSVQK